MKKISRLLPIVLLTAAAACSSGPPPREIAEAPGTPRRQELERGPDRGTRVRRGGGPPPGRPENTWNERKDAPTAMHWARLAEGEARQAQYRAEARMADEAVRRETERKRQGELSVRDAEIAALQARARTEAEKRAAEAEARAAADRRAAEDRLAAQDAAAREREQARLDLEARLAAERSAAESDAAARSQAERDKAAAELEKTRADLEASRQAAEDARKAAESGSGKAPGGAQGPGGSRRRDRPSAGGAVEDPGGAAQDPLAARLGAGGGARLDRHAPREHLLRRQQVRREARHARAVDRDCAGVVDRAEPARARRGAHPHPPAATNTTSSCRGSARSRCARRSSKGACRPTGSRRRDTARRSRSRRTAPPPGRPRTGGGQLVLEGGAATPKQPNGLAGVRGFRSCSPASRRHSRLSSAKPSAPRRDSCGLRRWSPSPRRSLFL